MTEKRDALISASGKWPSILMSLGLAESFLTGKHGPCPECEGKDRFRWISSAAGGRWICNGCGSGDGMDLACMILKMDFKEAIEKVKPLVNGAAYANAPKKPDKAKIAARSRELMSVWREAKDREIVRKYLVDTRGLPEAAIKGANLRGGSIKRFDADGKCVGFSDAMLAKIATTGNRAACLHRTYIEPREKKITVTVRPWNGGSIRLFRLGGSDTLLVSEGIETGLAARWLYHLKRDKLLPVWALVSAEMMKKFAIPDGVKRLIIFGDNDASYTGQAAAYELARRAVVQNKIEAHVWIPPRQGDWLNVLTRAKRLPEPPND